MKFLKPAWTACRWCAHGVLDLCLWTLWLLLALLLVLQAVIGISQEIRVPARLVRSFDDRLAIAGLRASFDSAKFDATGRVSVDNFRLFGAGFKEPLLTCQVAYIQLDRWSLGIGQLEPERVICRNLQLLVPPMLSPTGKSEAVVDDVDLTLDLDDRTFSFRELKGRAGKLSFIVRGDLRLPPGKKEGERDLHALLDRAVQQYLKIFRRVVEWEARLDGLDQPRLEIELVPHETQFALAHVVGSADRVEADAASLGRFAGPTRIRFIDTRLQTTLPLRVTGRTPVELRAQFREVAGLRDAKLTGASVLVKGDLDFGAAAKFELGTVDAALHDVRAHSVHLSGASVRVRPVSEGRWEGEMTSLLADEAWNVRASVDPAKGSGSVDVSGKVYHPLLRAVGARLGRDLNALLSPEQPADIRLRAELADGWKLARATGALSVAKVDVRGVKLDGASALISYDGHTVWVEDIVLKQGESIARGTYWMDRTTLDYRFLLGGKLRPVGISGWFGGWWPRFWSNFAFDAAAPAANVDVRGRWKTARETSVFISVDGKLPVVRNVAFDRVRTTLFIRPQFYDAIELIANRPEGDARGRFTRSVGEDDRDWLSLDFAAEGSVDVHEVAKIFGPEGISIVEPFVFEKPPHLKIIGRLEGPKSAQGKHESVNVNIDGTGPFTFFNFPLSNLRSRVHVRDDDLHLPELAFGFANGEVKATAKVSGKGEARTLTFDGKLVNASLGEAIRTLENFGAQRRGEKPPPTSRFQQRVAMGRLDLSAKASGLYTQTYSYTGKGQAELRGAELAEINLLGALSQALRGNSLLGFTSWSLDTARADFSIERERLVFPELTITGPSAKLEGKGFYALDAKAMNFNAKFYPYDQGKTLLASAVDLVLTPVSAALELKLSGSLENPRWYFAYGPTGIIKKLAGQDAEAKPTPEPDPAQARKPPLMLRR